MKTTVPLHQAIVRDPAFLDGGYTIKWLEQWLQSEDQQSSEGQPTRA
jgi:acetyl-CoA carboxylase biotin carboxylase subunit